MITAKISNWLMAAFCFMVCLSLFVTPAEARTKDKCKDTDKRPARSQKSQDGVPCLIELSKSNKAMQGVLDGESARYNRMAKAIDEGSIQKGKTQQEILDTIGEPVVKLAGKEAGTTEWIYKPGKETYFGKKKIYLIFDGSGKLIDLKMPPVEK